jgi:hypothetical protein
MKYGFFQARQGWHICSIGNHLFFQAPFSNDIIGTFRPAGAGNDGRERNPLRAAACQRTRSDLPRRCAGGLRALPAHIIFLRRRRVLKRIASDGAKCHRVTKIKHHKKTLTKI